ncbi:MAG TPA: hypothetical protein VGA04_24470, partial [Streptosporangiaceae bacterium]
AGLGQGVLLAVEQLAGGADPGVADQRAGPDGWLWRQKAAGAFGRWWGRSHGVPVVLEEKPTDIPLTCGGSAGSWPRRRVRPSG